MTAGPAVQPDTTTTRDPRWLASIMAAEMDQAARTAPEEVCRRRLSLAGMPVTMIFAGRALADILTRALSHLLVSGDGLRQPELCIEVWDGMVTRLGRPGVDLRDLFADSLPFADGVLAHTEDRQFFAFQNLHATSLLDVRARRISCWVASVSSLTQYETGKPLQPLLFAWYGLQGVQPVHAGLIAAGGNGVLLGGAGGSGKSTTSLVCAQAGFSYLADDYVGLPPVQHGTQTAFSLYSSLWLEEQHSRHFPSLGTHRLEGDRASESKASFALADALPGTAAAHCTVRAVVLPRVAHCRDTTLRRASTAEALLRLAPSSVLQLPFIEPTQALARMAALLRLVPSFWLDLGTEFDQIPLCVREALHWAWPYSSSGGCS